MLSFNLFKKKEDNTNKKKFVCPGAFSQVYIYPDGRVFLCPDCMMSASAEIGNLNNAPFKKIWNSKVAIKIRKHALNGEYPLCYPPSCFSKSNYNCRLIPTKNLDYSVKQKKLPKMVCIGADAECNINCIMCRKDISRVSKEELKILNEKIEKLYIPILKDAEELTLSTTADPFASRNTRLLMKTAAQRYPKLKFNLLTNGILFDEYNCIDTGIINRLSYVMFSIHGSNEETYNKIARNGNFKRVKENLKYASSLKQEGKLKGLYLAFVVSAKNYEDIPNFIEFAKENNAVALFWGAFDWGGNLSFADEPLIVSKPDNPKFGNFMQVINSIDLESDYSHFSLPLRRLKEMYNKEPNSLYFASYNKNKA